MKLNIRRFLPYALPTTTQTGVITFCLNTFTFLLKYVAIPSPTSSLFSQDGGALSSQGLPAKWHHNRAADGNASMWAAVAPQVLIMRQMGHPTQLGCPVCLLLGLQSLWLWTHSGPNSNSCLFSPLLVLLRWITHRNSFLGKSILGHTLFSFARDVAFPESVDTGKQLGRGMWGALYGANFMSGRENFFFSSSIKTEIHIEFKKEMGRKWGWSCLSFCVFSYFRKLFLKTLRKKDCSIMIIVAHSFKISSPKKGK